MSWARFEKSWQSVPHDLLNSTAVFCTCGDLKYFPLLTHLWMYHEWNSSCATGAFVLPFAGRISLLSHLRQPAEHSSETVSRSGASLQHSNIWRTEGWGVAGGRKFPPPKLFHSQKTEPGKNFCPQPLPVLPPSSHHSHSMYLFFSSDQRAAFRLFQTANVNHRDRTCSFYMMGLCWAAKHFCRLLAWAIGWVKERSSKPQLVSQRQLLSPRLLWPFLFIFV